MYELRQSLLDSATPERVKAIADKLADLAEAGDVLAAKLWLEFVVGKPAQAIELSGLDGSPLGVSISELKMVILAAVGDDPAGRVKVARALRALTQPAPSEGPSDEVSDDQTA